MYTKKSLPNVMSVPFNKIFSPKVVINDMDDVLSRKEFSSRGKFIEKCKVWIGKKLMNKGVYLTTSCTTALEASVRCLNLNEEMK